ncbi:MAG: luciferase family protein [Anaerolineae bacterium]
MEAVPEVNAELFRRAFALPGVENRPSTFSLPGARGMWIGENVQITQPDQIVSGREFAHIHPDGSLHASLPHDRALEAVEAGWAEPQPIAEQLGVPGLVMIYTPQSPEELEAVLQLVVDAYNFVTGQGLDVSDIGVSQKEP